MPDQPPVVTLFADASLVHKTGKAGYGVWIKTSQKTLTAKGPLNAHGCTQSHEAELGAVASGIFLAVKNELLLPGAMLVVKSDNVRVLSVLNPRKNNKSISNVEQYYLDVIQETLKKAKPKEIRLQHVKGHSSSRDHPRFWVHNLCDKLAREGRDMKHSKVRIRESVKAPKRLRRVK